MFLDYSLFVSLLYMAISCWNVPYITPIRDKFPSQFENVVLRNLKYFFQLDQQIDISLYLTEATIVRHCRELVGLIPSWCDFSPISLFSYPNFTVSFISVHNLCLRCYEWSCIFQITFILFTCVSFYLFCWVSFVSNGIYGAWGVHWRDS